MTKRIIQRIVAWGYVSFCLSKSFSAPALEELFDERSASILVVEFFVETEIDRRPTSVNGIVIDSNGVIQLSASAVPSWVPVDKLKEFKVYRLGESESHDAIYLGSDREHGWHYVQAEEAIRDKLKPITNYPIVELKTGQPLWGIGVAMKDMDFAPYFMRAEVSTIQKLPETVGFATSEITSPGSLLFANDGSLVGWGSSALNMERYLTIEGRRYQAYLRKPDQTTVFYVASELVKSLGNIPESPDINDMTWLGVVGLQTIDDEVAELMGLGDQAAISISQILKGSPAAKAGLVERDMVLSVDGKPLKRYTPRRVVVADFEQQIAGKAIGDSMLLGISRGGKLIEIEVPLEQAPKPVRQADRKYFEDTGLTIREFVVYDNVSLKLDLELDEIPGVIVSFVKPNSNAQTGGSQNGDLIKEIDGVAIRDFDQAVSIMEELESNDSKNDFVMLVARGAETSVLRVTLD